MEVSKMIRRKLKEANLHQLIIQAVDRKCEEEIKKD
jgi:hypothetical protein